MAVTSEATSVWTGDLKSGEGTTTLNSSKAGEFRTDWAGRADGAPGSTTPEELLGAAHASCFSMAFANVLKSNGANPIRVRVTAAITFDANEVAITGSHLMVDAEVENVNEEDFQRYAKQAKEGCPVSKALIGIPITMEARLSA
ncbi:MAG: OsmC family peroxiredoxin [Microbacteriaceae bacterium]